MILAAVEEPERSRAVSKRADCRFSLLVAVCALVAASCQPRSQSLETAIYGGTSSVDYVGRSEAISPDGENDGVVSVHLNAGGTITAITLHNVDGQPAAWDTIPDNLLWALAVADKKTSRVLLNRPGRGVEIKVDKPIDLLLYFTDNGALRGGKTRFEVTITYATKNVDVAQTTH
jgi:hypothetical protein